MLNEQIKENTKQHHQELEKVVVVKIKGMESKSDYADLLQHFYTFFNAVENDLQNNLPESLKEYAATRRNAQHIAQDLNELGYSLDQNYVATRPNITNVNQAIGALYVLEGSIMGGPYIVKMLQQKGIDTGFNFFTGYGEQSREKWSQFTSIINNEVSNEADIQEAIEAAQETFNTFGKTFESNANVRN